MRQSSKFSARSAFTGLVAAALALVSVALQAEPPIVNPGAPGQPSRVLSAEEAVALATAGYSEADVKFMQDMIPHHHQALEMSRLVEGRTGRNDLDDVAGRIDASQADEIEFMLGWLRERGEEAPDPAAHHAMHVSHEMAGMASPEQMAELEAARGDEFDQLFLQLMIRHHEGALKMVEDLLEESGAVQDPVLFEFVNDIKADQTAEIERMNLMLASLSPDPRVGLAVGLHDAGQAILNMELLAALPRPTGFFDPNNPSDLPPSRLRETLEDEAAAVEDDAEEPAAEEEDPEDERAPLLSFSNTDMAFAGDLLFAGSYHGFNIYDVSGDGIPELLTSVVCPGGQGDVSVVGDLLIMSVEQTRGRLDCGLQGAAGTVNEARFRGLRIFDISDISMPVQVGAVQTCRGSHTHSVVSAPGEDGRIIVYNSGTSSVRDEEEMEGCIDESPWKDDRTALFRIDVIEIPVDRPWDARIIDSPAVFADPETGALAGLWEGGDHGDDTQETNETNHCHDITVFPELNIAAGACSGNGILFDITDPLNPQRIDEVVDSGFAYWHSATFNNDGSKVLFTDEWGGGTRARCRASDPLHWGANAIYDIVDGKLEFRSYYKMPAPQTDKENCVAHNGSIVPVPGRDIFVQAWYQGGISVMDFTDSSNPVEIAFFDRGPIDEEDLVTGGYWSAYWHRDKVYGTEIVRGLDTLALTPSEHLSANEIAAASMTVNAEVFNPQQQHRLHWRHVPVVARAWIDQLVRTEVVAEGRVRELESALTRAEQILHQGASDSGLAAELDRLAEAANLQSGQSSGRGASRLAGLAETLHGIADRLRGG